jgi:hypothetical protein
MQLLDVAACMVAACCELCPQSLQAGVDASCNCSIRIRCALRWSDNVLWI